MVCCYPDSGGAGDLGNRIALYERLLGAAAERARRLLVFSYPVRNTASRLFIAAQNAGFRLVAKEFRMFAHPPPAMHAVQVQLRLHDRFAHHGLVWRVAALAR